ncbi:RNA polymerase sigma factor [Pedobacter arcticus]|uniref:RNA polymerase sigma factor n=1 Tax=Pedobacter arcticus TaxID=752140 RepID=UPI0002E967F5|nr:sigma-70 family RNA polymerase sigma factor [Pedobacter arcticus]
MIDDILHEQTLLADLKLGCQDAFTQIYRKYWQVLYNAAYKRLGNKAHSQDAVQLVFTSLWDRRQKLEIQNISAYLHTAVKFQVFKQVARAPKTSEFLSAFENIITSPVATDDLVLEKEVLNLVKMWIEALPKKRKEIFLLHYNEGLPTDQIANKLNISRKTVQNQLNTANLALRLRLTQFLSLLILFAQ